MSGALRAALQGRELAGILRPWHNSSGEGTAGSCQHCDSVITLCTVCLVAVACSLQTLHFGAAAL